MTNKITTEVIFDYYNRVYNKNNYIFTDNKTGKKYRWITSLIYNLLEKQQYKIEFIKDSEVGNEIIIKNVSIYQWKPNSHKDYSWKKIDKC